MWLLHWPFWRARPSWQRFLGMQAGATAGWTAALTANWVGRRLLSPPALVLAGLASGMGAQWLSDHWWLHAPTRAQDLVGMACCVAAVLLAQSGRSPTR